MPNWILRAFAGILIVSCGTAAAEDAPTSKPAGPVSTFEFVLKKPAPLTSAGVFDANGALVRQLWALKPLAAGRHTGQWDGLDESGKPAGAGKYEFRIVANRSIYKNVGIIGNTGVPHNEMGHIQHGVRSVTTDAKGRIYTANGWEEAGHDFKVMDTGGKTLFHARYQIRNGKPNGAPHAIAVDDTHIYCATHGWASKEWKSKQQIQRFRISDGKHETFSEIKDNAGHIELYEWPEKQIPENTPAADAALMRNPVKALTIHGNEIIATDALAGKIHRFHKVTGKKLGEFPLPLPGAIAIGSKGRIWVAHQHNRVSIFTPAGKRIATPLTGLGEIESLAFNRNGMLYIADSKTAQVRICEVSGNSAKQVRTFGRPAKPGDAEADSFYQLRGASIDPTGCLVTIQTLPAGGAKIARHDAKGKLLWEHMALMFCDVGNYAPWRPEEFITHRFHRLTLGDKNAGQWKYTGTILDGDAKYINWQHGVLRPLRLGKAEFLLQCYGDGMQIYRRNKGLYRLVSMIGGVNPLPDGRYNDRLPNEQKQKLGQWTWTDANGDAKADDKEIVWFRQPGKGRYAVFGMNTDAKGNILYCDHHTHAIWELPLARFDTRGNPVYDWSAARQIIAKDDSPVGFFPLMALRAEDESIYSFGRSKAWKRPGGKTAGAAWMGGWALRRYDKKGKTLWSARLPAVCVGMDAIPGGKGVMLGYFQKAHVYHYTPDGLLIGQMAPGEAAGKVTGWMDNTSAVAVNRDSRDGMLDVFGEDSWLNRAIWYRVDDRDIQRVSGTLQLSAREAGSFGVASSGESFGDHARLFPLLGEAGVTMVRSFPEWASFQPTKGAWDFSAADALIGSARKNRIQIAGVFMYLAPWASSAAPREKDHGKRTRTFPIKDMRYWRDYVKGVVARYHKDVKYWEVYNEFNSSAFARKGSVKDYVQMVRGAYKAAREADPQCKIGIGCADVDISFLQQVIARGAAGHFDFVNVHPYSLMSAVMDGREPMFLQMAANLRKMLAKANQRRKIDLCSEIGVASTDKPQAERKQAEAIAKAYTLCLAQGIDRVFWFEGRGRAYGPDGDFGIIRNNWTKRPSFQAMQTLTGLLGRRPQYLGWLNPTGKSYAFVFQGKTGPVLVTWATGDKGDRLRFPTTVTTTDLAGKAVEAKARRDITLTRTPVFITNLPKKQIADARANHDRRPPWLKDYSKAKSVSCSMGAANAESGLTQLEKADGKTVVGRVDGAHARRTDIAGKSLYMYFDVDDSYVSLGDNEVEITIAARRVDRAKAGGCNLTYESVKGYRQIGQWWTVPSKLGWHEHTFRLKDANFANNWGWNFRIDVVSSPGDIWVKKVTVKRIGARK